MKKALLFLANGFEEIEAITLVDILRRAGIHVDMCSIYESFSLIGAHNIEIRADVLLKEVQDPRSYDIVITPGGMPGSAKLRDNPTVIEIIRSFYRKKEKYIASICASPIVLERASIASEVVGTCYPGFEEEVGFKKYQKEAVVMDQNVITSMGPGTAFCLAVKLVEVLMGKEISEKLYQETMFEYCKQG